MPEQSNVPVYPFPYPSALEPPVEWERLRAECPVARVQMVSGDPALLLTRYDDVRDLLSDNRFSRELTAPDAARVTSTDEGGVFNRPAASSASGEGGEHEGSIMTDGRAHRRWRLTVGRAFTVKRVTALRPKIEQLAEQLIDDMVASGAPADIGPALGFPLPVFVICELLGVPAQDRHRFAYWSDTSLSLTRYSQEEVNAARAEFHGYMVDLVAGKRAQPGDDLISTLLATVGQEDGLTEAEIVMTGQGLLIAGHETTANMISKMVSMLLSRRERWEALLADPSLVRAATEEALRFDANSGFGMPRYVSEEIELGGETIPAGSTVVCSMAAANRDERTYPGADDMDLTRTPNPHLAFGAGLHSCIGQSLARTELQVVLATLLRRLPTLELAVDATELQIRQGLIVGGLEAVPVRW